MPLPSLPLHSPLLPAADGRLHVICPEDMKAKDLASTRPFDGGSIAFEYDNGEPCG